VKNDHIFTAVLVVIVLVLFLVVWVVGRRE